MVRDRPRGSLCSLGVVLCCTFACRPDEVSNPITPITDDDGGNANSDQDPTSDSHIPGDGDAAAGDIGGDGREPFAKRANGGLPSGVSTFDGKVFLPLTDYLSDGEAHNSDEALRGNYPIEGTDFPQLYQVETWLPHTGSGATFTFPIDNGDYTVHLHFVDWAMESVGDRIFHVDLQGRRVIDDLDIIATVGKNTVLIKSFAVSVSDGNLALTITNVVGYPEIAAVEIVEPGEPFLGQVVVTQPPAAPTTLTATAIASHSVELSWFDTANNESSYEVEWRRAVDVEFNAPTTLGANAQTHVVTGLQANTEYVFRIAARNALGHSGYSNEAHATTYALPDIDCLNATIRCVDDTAGEHQEYTSIQAAVDAAVANDTVYVRAGLYREAVTINKDNLTLRAFPSEEGQAVISGAIEVTGWALADPSVLDGNPNATQIYEATAPCEVHRLFVNGQELKASRYPPHNQSGEDRYLRITSNTSNTVFGSSTLNAVQADGYFNSAMAHVRTTQWTMGAARVTSSSAAGTIVLARTLPTYPPDIDRGFYFTQVVGEIGPIGSWAWRGDKLYLWSASVPAGLEAACRDHGVRISASVANVAVHGMAVRHAAGDCIVVDQITNQGVTISDNTIMGCGGRGISIQNGGGPVRILDNEISACREMGIELRSTAAPLVRGNTISEIGAQAYNDDALTTGGNYRASGIVLIDSADAVITENRIEKTVYSGILLVNFGGPSGNRIVSYNYVTDALLGLNDGAGIYFHTNNSSAHPRDQISHNIVKNCIGAYLGTTVSSGYRPQGVGIYIDNGTDTGHVDIHDNTMAHNYTNMFFHDTHENHIADNVLFATVVNHSHTNLFLKSYCSYATQNNLLNGNTLFSANSEIRAMRLWAGAAANCELIGASDYNIFGVVGSSEYIQDEVYGVQTDYYDLTGWQTASGMDSSSHEVTTCPSPVLLTNPSLQTASCSGLAGCKDLLGVDVISVSMDSFGSQILCACDAEPSCAP